MDICTVISQFNVLLPGNLIYCNCLCYSLPVLMLHLHTHKVVKVLKKCAAKNIPSHNCIQVYNCLNSFPNCFSVKIYSETKCKKYYCTHNTIPEYKFIVPHQSLDFLIFPQLLHHCFFSLVGWFCSAGGPRRPHI